ncbi:MAG TPA: hypothetical protein VFN61_06035 [Acidimicrobiales bacterium]|nr:hypothetical protein [Acidimicrobiales bacterium]
MNASFQVVVVQPDGYTHAAAFAEVTETVACGLRSLGAQVTVAVNRIVVPGPPPIVFGANLLEPHEVPMLPEGTIIYNLEQIASSSGWCTPHYLEALRRHAVWDYSARNIAALHDAGIGGAEGSHVVHVPIGYVPELSRIPQAGEQDIDVLFYGSVNERRQKALDALRASGLRTHVAFNVYGAHRDELISRSKVVLNVHYYDTSIFELVRVSYLLANRKAVVAEYHEGTEIDDDIRGGVCLAAYDDLVAACQGLVADGARRRQLEDEGYRRMAARDERMYLSDALAATSRQLCAVTPSSNPCPTSGQRT